MTPITVTELYHILYAKLGPQHWWPAQSTVNLLCATVLIQNTNVANLNRALYQLDAATNFGLNTILRLSDDELEQLIRPSGFYRSKRRYLQALLTAYRDHHLEWQQLPTDTLRRELLALPGIGGETADVILLYVYHRLVFVADTYARRLFAALGLPSKNYADLKRQVTLDLTPAAAQEFHALIDEYGKLGPDAFDLGTQYVVTLQ